MAQGPTESWFGAWRDAADRVLQRAAELRQRVQDARPHEMLELGAPGSSTVVLRFDDRLDSATVVRQPEPRSMGAESTLARFEFDGSDAASFAPEVAIASRDASVRTEDGCLVFADVDRRELVAELSKPFRAGRAVEIHIRARLQRAWDLRIGWRGTEPGAGSSVTLSGSPGEAFRLYKIDARCLFSEHPDATVTQLTLQCPDLVGDRLDVDFIRVLSRPAMFLERALGTGRIDHDGENRPVLFALPGTEIAFQTALPEGPLVLSTGAAALDATGPLTLVLESGDRTGTELLASLTIDPHTGWQEYRRQLPTWLRGEQTLRLRIEGHDGIALLSSPLLYRPQDRPQRVVLLIQDALRADHLSTYGAARPTSPFTSRLAGGGTLFRRVISQAPATRMSVASYFSSLHPTAVGVRAFDDIMREEYLTLAEVLRHAGWATVSITENPNAGVMAGGHQGFDRLYELSERGAALQQLQSSILSTIPRDRPAFLYVHVLDPHWPYDPSPGHRWMFEALSDPSVAVEPSELLDPPWISNPTRAGRRALYDGLVESNDGALAELFTTLEQRGWTASTLMVLASDHGEYLGEGGEWGHHAPGLPPVLHTPLIIISPGRVPAGLTVDEPVQNLDIMPTILDLVGYDPSALPLEGDSLVPLLQGRRAGGLRDRLIVSEETSHEIGTGWTDDRGSFVFASRFVMYRPTEYPRVLDWHRGFAAERTGPLSRAFGSEIERFFQALHREHVAIARLVVGDSEGSVTVSSEALEQLRALGYTE